MEHGQGKNDDQISLMPTMLEVTDREMKYRSFYYCLDMRSRTGFSGSPVFYYRTSGSDLSQAGSTSIRIEPAKVGFIGIHASQYHETITMKDSVGNKTELTAPSGMTMVIPSQEILKLLHIPKFVEARKAAEIDFLAKHPARKNIPVLETN